MIEELTHIVTDPAHMVAELLSEGVFFLVGVGYTNWKLRRRDAEHGHRHELR